jgi:hypothetical protein|tara:strand:- start:1346 stop:1510 length:165 start_codon:yes stop_codon:yes gene_type:complete
MFRIIFILICIVIFAYSISKVTNLNKDTSRNGQIIWGLVILGFLGLLIALVTNS